MKSCINKICLIVLFVTSFLHLYSQTPKLINLDIAKPSEIKDLGFDQQVLDDFEKEVSKSIQQKEIAGAVTLIARKGKIIHFEAKGESQMETHIPMKKDAIFRLASMTKPIATLALLLEMFTIRPCK